MPELPEVETIRRGIEKRILGRLLEAVTVRRADLRWQVPVTELQRELPGKSIQGVSRRGKYLLLEVISGTILIHLGMSGHLRLGANTCSAGKHDHLDFLLKGGDCLRFHDPRRFGAVLWCVGNAADHPLLASLGPEPLTENFHGRYLHKLMANRSVPIKNILMNSRVVAGIGNIYAAESLFAAGIHPTRPAGSLSQAECHGLVVAIKDKLTQAIAQGGTTLRDFLQEEGKPGHFQFALQVYGRKGSPCPQCGSVIAEIRLAGRASAYCPHCQGES